MSLLFDNLTRPPIFCPESVLNVAYLSRSMYSIDLSKLMAYGLLGITAAIPMPHAYEIHMTHQAVPLKWRI
jgi:hypothetical protein